MAGVAALESWPPVEDRKPVKWVLFVGHDSPLDLEEGSPIVGRLVQAAAANQGFFAVTGYAAADVLGRKCRVMQDGYLNLPWMAELRRTVRGVETDESVQLAGEADCTFDQGFLRQKALPGPELVQWLSDRGSG